MGPRAQRPKQPVLMTLISLSSPAASSSRSKAVTIRPVLYALAPLAPMVYSVTGLPLTMCWLTMVGTISGVTFT